MLRDEILDNVRMQDIFNKYGFIPNRSGFIRCPFHKEKTASLSAYKNDTRFKCFGCGKGGNVIDFVMELFNIDFRQAIARLAYDFNISDNATEYAAVRRQNDEFYRRRAEQEEKERKAEEAQEIYYDLLMLWERLNGITDSFEQNRADFSSEEIYSAYIQKEVAEYLMDLYNSRERRFCCG